MAHGRAIFPLLGGICDVDVSTIHVPQCLGGGVPPYSRSYVYLLLDPRNGRVRYVGQTTDVVARIRTHASAVSKQSAKRDWVESLRGLGLPPVMFVLRPGGIPEETATLAHVLAAGAGVLNIGAQPRKARVMNVENEAVADTGAFMAALASVNWTGAVRWAHAARSAVPA